MEFSLSSEQKLIFETISEFSNREIKSQLMDWDERQYFPIEIFKKLGELGMLGVLVPEKYGGSGFGYDDYD